MSEIETIAVSRRENLGKGASRAARRAGSVPGVVYGLNETPVAIAIEELALNRLLTHANFFSHMFSLEVAGQKMNVLARDLQVHPVTDRPMHIDFLRVSADTAIDVEVPAVFINEEDCPGLNEGGILNIVRYTVEVSCRPDAIPDQIEIDLTGYEMGDSIHISSVKLPEGVEPTITDRDFTVATIAAPAKTVEEEDAEAAAAEAEAAGEGEDEDGEAPEAIEEDDDNKNA